MATFWLACFLDNLPASSNWLDCMMTAGTPTGCGLGQIRVSKKKLGWMKHNLSMMHFLFIHSIEPNCQLMARHQLKEYDISSLTQLVPVIISNSSFSINRQVFSLCFIWWSREQVNIVRHPNPTSHHTAVCGQPVHSLLLYFNQIISLDPI